MRILGTNSFFLSDHAVIHFLVSCPVHFLVLANMFIRIVLSNPSTEYIIEISKLLLVMKVYTSLSLCSIVQ